MAGWRSVGEGRGFPTSGAPRTQASSSSPMWYGDDAKITFRSFLAPAQQPQPSHYDPFGSVPSQIDPHILIWQHARSRLFPLARSLGTRFDRRQRQRILSSLFPARDYDRVPSSVGLLLYLLLNVALQILSVMKLMPSLSKKKMKLMPS